jgi:MFS transporter, DHA3 family, macrolide efflux protein
MSTQSFRQFVILVIGQSVAMLGSSLTAFALGVWAYQKAGSVTDFTMIALAASLPMALFSPIAGALVDRWNRKIILLLGQTAAIVVTAVMAMLYWRNALDVWHITVLSAISSLFNAFVFPAVTASIPLMVKPEQLTRANSLISLVLGVVQLVAPAVAGGLMVAIGLKYIFVLNLIAFSVGVVALLMTPIPRPPVRDHFDPLYNGKFFEGILYGWRYMNSKPGLPELNLWTSAMAFSVYAIISLLTPMVLSFSDARGLGVVASMSGFGMLAGSLAMMARKSTANNMQVIMWGTTLTCIMYIAVPLLQAVWYVALCAFVVVSTFPVFNVCGQVIFQRKIAPEFQGRVTGLRNFLRGLMQPLALLTIGPLVDKVFGPAMLEGGSMAPWFGQLLGVGPGRGAALLIFVLGWLCLVWMVLAWLSPIRKIEQILPDYTDTGAITSAITTGNPHDHRA